MPLMTNPLVAALDRLHPVAPEQLDTARKDADRRGIDLLEILVARRLLTPLQAAEVAAEAKRLETDAAAPGAETGGPPRSPVHLPAVPGVPPAPHGQPGSWQHVRPGVTVIYAGALSLLGVFTIVLAVIAVPVGVVLLAVGLLMAAKPPIEPRIRRRAYVAAGVLTAAPGVVIALMVSQGLAFAVGTQAAQGAARPVTTLPVLLIYGCPIVGWALTCAFLAGVAEALGVNSLRRTFWIALSIGAGSIVLPFVGVLVTIAAGPGARMLIVLLPFIAFAVAAVMFVVGIHKLRSALAGPPAR
jgi:uncharacterized membrane protein